MPTDERTTRKYPLLLTTGRILTQYNVGAQTRRTANVTWHDEDVLDMHEADAELRGIADGSWVQVSSRAGTTSMRVRITDEVPAGVVYTTFHHPVSGANVVTTDNSDWATNCPEYKVTAVEVRPDAMAGRRTLGMRDDRLVRMANQIAANVPDPARAAEQTAAHLRGFWAPSMIEALAVVAAEQPERLTAAVREALSFLDPSSLRFRVGSGA